MTFRTVSDLLSQDVTLPEVDIKGWVRTFRANRFIALNDGSTINNIQCVQRGSELSVHNEFPVLR